MVVLFVMKEKLVAYTVIQNNKAKAPHFREKSAECLESSGFD